MITRNKNIVRAKFPRVYEYHHPKSGTYFLVDARRKKWGLTERKTFPTKGKTPARYVDLEPVAVEWIKFHRKNTPEGTPFVNVTNLENRMKKIRIAVFNGKWIQDGLRHGFGTHYKGLTQSIHKVADQMGNSVGIVLRHYARTITKDECDAFWKLTPAVVMADEPESNPSTN